MSANPFNIALADSGVDDLPTKRFEFNHGYGRGRTWQATFEGLTIHTHAERMEYEAAMVARYWPGGDAKPDIPMIEYGKAGRVRPMCVTRELVTMSTWLGFGCIELIAPEGIEGLATLESRRATRTAPENWLRFLQNVNLYDECLPVVDWLFEQWWYHIQDKPGFLARLKRNGFTVEAESESTEQESEPQSDPDSPTPTSSTTLTDC